MAVTAKIKTPKAIVGPVIADLASIGGGDVTVATAFYSAGALNALSLKADKLRLLIRLDLSSPLEWASGSINPPALRDFIQRHNDICDEVSLFVSPTAHAKIYRGERGYFIGSANLSVRALSGSAAEILWFENDHPRCGLMDRAIDDYSKMFISFGFEQLNDYIVSHEKEVARLKKKIPQSFLITEDRPPDNIVRPARLGDYDHFLKWLSRQKGGAAKLIAERAGGKGQLTGHIRQNFFGLRQYFLTNPNEMRLISKKDPDSYSLSADSGTARTLSDFVTQRAHDEGPFKLSTWRTYLPESAGGKPKTGGGTSGNLKRMLPLVARYVRSKVEDN
ncbi:hypothetical protein Gxy13693_088_004 [Komagataeibacter xylinus NBRC 13693]|uniref:Phospholipase D-like domain-containing protein n=1 Tax=Komagataeibacter xylinus NBRC 13693 TaxID=1234668 RepID=A0A0D6QDG5_KOMXY|nr:hypothetical protein [Komagataeibacter xylinus]GAO01026.1 hypothetical protein Gxy13693_088_004 [Komagataeibacter xylinus NBRC 13693]